MSERLPKVLMLTGVTTIVVGIALTIALGIVWPLLAVAVGIIDIVLAALFRSGVIGRPGGSMEGEPEQDAPTGDGEYGTLSDGTPITEDANPYARED